MVSLCISEGTQCGEGRVEKKCFNWSLIQFTHPSFKEKPGGDMTVSPNSRSVMDTNVTDALWGNVKGTSWNIPSDCWSNRKYRAQAQPQQTGRNAALYVAWTLACFQALRSITPLWNDQTRVSYFLSLYITQCCLPLSPQTVHPSRNSLALIHFNVGKAGVYLSFVSKRRDTSWPVKRLTYRDKRPFGAIWSHQLTLKAGFCLVRKPTARNLTAL